MKEIVYEKTFNEIKEIWLKVEKCANDPEHWISPHGSDKLAKIMLFAFDWLENQKYLSYELKLSHILALVKLLVREANLTSEKEFACHGHLETTFIHVKNRTKNKELYEPWYIGIKPYKKVS